MGMSNFMNKVNNSRVMPEFSVSMFKEIIVLARSHIYETMK